MEQSENTSTHKRMSTPLSPVDVLKPSDPMPIAEWIATDIVQRGIPNIKHWVNNEPNRNEAQAVVTTRTKQAGKLKEFYNQALGIPFICEESKGKK